MSLTAVLFLAGLLIGCALALARHPIYGLMTYTAVYYLDPPDRWWGASLPHVRWELLAALVTLIALFVQRNRRRPAIPLTKQGVMWGVLLFLTWISVQSLWALDLDQHLLLVTIMAKYALLVGLIYLTIESEQHLQMFLWMHVLGCIYLGWIAYTTYHGGRFEGFGGADINEANAGALQVATGIFVGSALFLASRWRGKAALFCGMPLLVNALVVTESRSGFLALGVGGLLFNLFTPAGFRLRVRALSILALALFLMLTNPLYWTRISTIEYAGAQVQGVDTGHGRMDIVKAQWRMFVDHPLGCGHRCTAVLSPSYLPNKDLTGSGENRARASHSTVMTLLVEHSIPGVLLYALLAAWLYRRLAFLVRTYRNQEGLMPTLVPAIAAMAAALFVGDQFVDELLLEVRFWMIGIVMVMLKLTAERVQAVQPSDAAAPATVPRPARPASVPAARSRDGRRRVGQTPRRLRPGKPTGR